MPVLANESRALSDKAYLISRAPLILERTMPRQRPPLEDAYEAWLKKQPSTPSSRRQKDKVEADVYEAWLRQRIEKKRPTR